MRKSDHVKECAKVIVAQMTMRFIRGTDFFVEEQNAVEMIQTEILKMMIDLEN